MGWFISKGNKILGPYMTHSKYDVVVSSPTKCVTMTFKQRKHLTKSNLGMGQSNSGINNSSLRNGSSGMKCQEAVLSRERHFLSEV